MIEKFYINCSLASLRPYIKELKQETEKVEDWILYSGCTIVVLFVMFFSKEFLWRG
jgi:hypothetical protein